MGFLNKKQSEQIVESVKEYMGANMAYTMMLNFTVKQNIKGTAYSKFDKAYTDTLNEILMEITRRGYSVKTMTAIPTSQKGINGATTITQYTLLIEQNGVFLDEQA